MRVKMLGGAETVAAKLNRMRQSDGFTYTI